MGMRKICKKLRLFFWCAPRSLWEENGDKAGALYCKMCMEKNANGSNEKSLSEESTIYAGGEPWCTIRTANPENKGSDNHFIPKQRVEEIIRKDNEEKKMWDDMLWKGLYDEWMKEQTKKEFMKIQEDKEKVFSRKEVEALLTVIVERYINDERKIVDALRNLVCDEPRMYNYIQNEDNDCNFYFSADSLHDIDLPRCCAGIKVSFSRGDCGISVQRDYFFDEDREKKVGALAIFNAKGILYHYGIIDMEE